MVNTSSKRQKIYIYCEISHIFTLYGAKVMITYFLISRESHFPLQVLHILDTILVHCILHILGTILVHCLI